MKMRPCPHCRKPTDFSESNPFRPFCSDRCQVIDLGKWADEGYFIPGEKVDIENQPRDESRKDDDIEDEL